MSAFTLITQAIAGAISARGAKKSAEANQAGRRWFELQQAILSDCRGWYGGVGYEKVRHGEELRGAKRGCVGGLNDHRHKCLTI